ncbi:MAG: hypothetical protein VX218_02685, partial [Pseudomonadota bacterium]|nr:hypothetical protein [Pseudomonadota bacterium]
FSYIDVPEFAGSLVIREELLLTIYERLEEADIGIAFPTRTITFAAELPIGMASSARSSEEDQVTSSQQAGPIQNGGMQGATGES